MGVLGHYRNSVTLVNRTNRPLNVRYDGEDITLKPGENPGFPSVAVPYAKKQNPLMGSQHPNLPQLASLKKAFISLVGVKADPGEKQRDDISQISEETLAIADGKMELMDRSGEFHGAPLRQNVKLAHREYTAYEAQAEVASGGFDVNKNID